MIANNSYTPIRRVKKAPYDTVAKDNKDDYEVNLRTSLNVQRKNAIIPNIVQI